MKTQEQKKCEIMVMDCLSQGSQFQCVLSDTGGMYRYVDHPLPGSSSVLTDTEAYRPVPPRISTVTEAYRSVRLGMVGKGIFKVLACTIGIP